MRYSYRKQITMMPHLSLVMSASLLRSPCWLRRSLSSSLLPVSLATSPATVLSSRRSCTSRSTSASRWSDTWTLYC